MNRFVIAEPSKCIGCRTCEVACVMAHPGGGSTAESLLPANFKPRLQLVTSKNVTAPVQCRQCENAPCVNVCPTNALVYRAGTVQLLEDRCIGCQTCVIVCPFGAMSMIKVPVTQVAGPLSVSSSASRAHKCDLCIDRPSGPACIPVCPTKALFLIEPVGLEEIASQRRDRALAGMPVSS